MRREFKVIVEMEDDDEYMTTMDLFNQMGAEILSEEDVD